MFLVVIYRLWLVFLVMFCMLLCSFDSMCCMCLVDGLSLFIWLLCLFIYSILLCVCVIVVVIELCRLFGLLGMCV